MERRNNPGQHRNDSVDLRLVDDQRRRKHDAVAGHADRDAVFEDALQRGFELLGRYLKP